MDINNFPRDGIIVGIFINKLYYISCHEFMLLLLFTEKEQKTTRLKNITSATKSNIVSTINF